MWAMWATGRRSIGLRGLRPRGRAGVGHVGHVGHAIEIDPAAWPAAMRPGVCGQCGYVGNEFAVNDPPNTYFLHGADGAGAAVYKTVCLYSIFYFSIY